MCTLSILKKSGQLLITMNRDERLDRSPEYPPLPWQDPRILAPIDPSSNGTWIAVRQDGYWAALLNGYADVDQNIQNAESRGHIIPTLLSAENPVENLQNLNLEKTRSFRLWIGDRDHYRSLFWDGTSLEGQHLPIESYQFVTSSSWRQDDVKAYRQKEFDRWLHENSNETYNGLPTIHLQFEEEKHEWGVLMRRDYAETKSITQIVLQEDNVAMNYWGRDTIHSEPFALQFAA